MCTIPDPNERPGGEPLAAAEAVASKNNWRSPKDGRFNFARYYRSDASDRYFRGRSQHGGSWGTLWDEVIDNKSSHFASNAGSDWVYFAGDGSQQVFNNNVVNGYRNNRRSFEPDKIGVSGSLRTLEDGSGLIKRFEPYNPGSTNGHTSYLKEIEWPDGYKITVTRTQSQGELIVQSISDNKGQRAEYTWQQQSLGYRTKDIVSQINVDTDYDGVTLQPDVQIDYTYAVANTSTSVNHERYRAITLTQVATTDIASGSVLSDYRYEYTRDDPSNLPLLTVIYQGDPAQPNGWSQLASYQYLDKYGRPTSTGVTASVGQSTISFNDPTYDALLTNPLGKETGVDFTTIQGVKKPSTVTGVATASCLGTAKSFDYTPNAGAPDGYVYERVERNGAKTTFTRDSRGLVLTKTEDADGAAPRVTTYTWHATLRLPLTRTTTQMQEGFTYDADGLLTSYTQTDVLTGSPSNGQTRTWTYGYTTLASGLKVMTSLDGPGLVVDGVTDVTTYAYNANGTLSGVTDPNGLVTSYTAYDAYGNPATIVAPDGTQLNLTHDGEGQLTQIVEFAGTPVASTSSFMYNIAGDITTYTDPENNVWTFTYDTARRLTEVAAPSGDTATYSHDAMGNVTRTEFADTTSTNTYFEDVVFDELGRLKTLLGADGQTTAFTHDVEDNLSTASDALNLTETYTYDALNRLTTVMDRAAHSTSMAHDDADQVMLYTDPRNIATSFTYNGFGEVLTEVSADRGTISYTYDSRGLVTSMTDGNGIVSNYAYDHGGRLTAKTYPSDATQNQSFSYGSAAEANGKTILVTDASGQTVISYDTDDGRITQTDTDIGAATYEMAYDFDLRGNLSWIRYPSQRAVRYTYDDQNRISKIETRIEIPDGGGVLPPWEVVVDTIQYLPFGPVSDFAFGTGSMTQARTHDSSYRLTRILEQMSGQEIRDVSHAYDTRDDLTTVTHDTNVLVNDRNGGTTLVVADAGLNAAFSYTNRQFLDTADGNYPRYDYGYDGSGNRVTLAFSQYGRDLTDSYAYPTTDNRLGSIDHSGNFTRSLGHDAAGNVISDNRKDGSFSFTYNAANRLSGVSRDGTLQAEYEYNALGQQVWRNQAKVVDEFHTLFDLSGNRIAEYAFDPTNTGAPPACGNCDTAEAKRLLREYIWMGSTPVAVVEDDVLYYVRTDHIGRPVFATDVTATKVWEVSYLPFGGVRTSTGSNINLRFPGQWFQLESGLHQNWMRDYDPTTGRYIQADPLGLVDGASVYGYALQNPGRYVDPSGQAVVFMCRPIQIIGGKSGGFTQHCAVFVIEDENDCGCDMQGDADGIIRQYSLRGGAINFDNPSNPSDVYNTDRAYFLTRKRGGRGGKGIYNGPTARHPIPLPAGMTSCEFDRRVIHEGSNFPDQDSYNAYYGPNSNTAADNLIENAGGTVPDTGAAAQNYGE